MNPDANLDYEAEPVMQLTIVAMDNGLPVKSLRKQFEVHLLNVNDPPSTLYLSNDDVSHRRRIIYLLYKSERVSYAAVDNKLPPNDR